MFARLRDRFRKHSEEICRMARYLIVGGWNTLFGVGTYAILYGLLHTRVNYLVLMIPANILAITNAYLGYKFFVFRTRGNYIQEYLRCYTIYGGSIILGFVLMYLLVSMLGLHPIPAQCLTLVISMICNYIGHRHFSFDPALASKSRE